MSTSPKTYRIYAMDPVRRILAADWLEASGDADAIARARDLGFGAKGEIWDGDRLVAKLEAVRLEA